MKEGPRVDGGKKNMNGGVGVGFGGGVVLKNKVFASPENSFLPECSISETLGI